MLFIKFIDLIEMKLKGIDNLLLELFFNFFYQVL
jgi:hypothetical protein